MAWVKPIVMDDTKITASYWDVLDIFYSKTTGKSVVRVGGWPTKWHHDQGGSPICIKTWEVPVGASPQLASGADAFMAAFALGQDEFHGATVVT